MKRKSKTSRRRQPNPIQLKSSSKREFLERLHSDSSMIEYFSSLGLMNPAAGGRSTLLNEVGRKGDFVSLAHAKSEFTAPVLSKGKSVVSRRQGRKKSTTKK